MEMSEFEGIVERAVSHVPNEFRSILDRENIQVLAREQVPEAIRDRYRKGILFGIFIGVPYSERSTFSLQLEPTRIEIYKNSFERVFRDRDEMEEQIVKTVIHEIGHYFGFSEKELRRRNL